MKPLIALCLLSLSLAQAAHAQRAECGDIEDGIQISQEFAKWKPQPLKGDMNNWYYNSTNRLQAALLLAKLRANGSTMTAAERTSLEAKVSSLCESLD